MDQKRMNELRTIRESKGLTRIELASKSGLSKNTIEALEVGITNVDNVKLSTLVKLAQALNCKVIHLLPLEMRKIIK